MNNCCEKNIGNNLLFFRNVFDLSQGDLAGKLKGVNQQTLSKYENFCGNPKISTIQNCANLFGVTVDSLINKDWSMELKDVKMFESKEFSADFLVKANKLIKLFCPILKNNVENDLFNEAVKLHEELIDEIYEPYYDVKFAKCMNFYKKCFDENAIYEAVANMISLSIVNLAKQRQTIEQKMALNEYVYRRISAKEYLRECSFNNRSDKTKLFCDPYERIMTMIRELKKSPEWCDLADVYIATTYLFGLIPNANSIPENQQVGLEMVNLLVLTNNSYISDFRNCEITSK